jgi:hypothetical protein
MMLSRICRCISLLFFVSLWSSSVLPQTSPPVSDPKAVALAAQAIAALTGGTAVSDVTISGSVVWTSGPRNATGTVVAYGKTSAMSRIDLTVGSGNRSEIRNNTNASAQGTWINAAGQSNSAAAQNCWTDPVWFFPALTSLSAVTTDNTLVLTYVGLETRNGVSVQHIRSYHCVASKFLEFTAFTQRASKVDYYLDAPTLVPLWITFNAHPDNDANTDIPVEIDFSDYQLVSGVLVPYHITKLWQGSPLFDFTATNATINSGLPDSLFSIQ